MKDWIGNAKSVYTCNGASNHSNGEREENDYYATEPRAVELLLENELFSPYVWECACGEGHISKVLKAHWYKVKSSDLYDRGYEGTEIIDFLKTTKEEVSADFPRDIITNPPYKFAKEFVCGGYGEAGAFKPSSKETPIIYLSGTNKSFVARL